MLTDLNSGQACKFIITKVSYGKRPLQGKHSCTRFQSVNVAASIVQMNAIFIPGEHACKPNYRVLLNTRGRLPWRL